MSLNQATNLKTKRMRSRLIFIVSIFVLTLVSLSEIVRLQGETEDSMKVYSESKIPVKELSAMAGWTSEVDNLYHFWAVGDSKAVVSEFVVSTDSKVALLRSVDFSEKLVKQFSSCLQFDNLGCQLQQKALTKDWEGLSRDASGKVFIAQEYTHSIFVIDPESKKTDNFLQIYLDMSQFKKFDLSKDNVRKKKSYGVEGIVLMKNGHILVAKESNPSVLIEFAPDEKSKALGVDGNTVLGEKENFKMLFPSEGFSRTKMSPVQYWVFDHTGECDISEISFDHSSDSLWLLSQQCRSLSEIKSLAVGKNSIRFNRVLGVKKKARTAEALSFGLNGNVWIGSDVKKGDNLFLTKFL